MESIVMLMFCGTVWGLYNKPIGKAEGGGVEPMPSLLQLSAGVLSSGPPRHPLMDAVKEEEEH